MEIFINTGQRTYKIPFFFPLCFRNLVVGKMISFLLVSLLLTFQTAYSQRVYFHDFANSDLSLPGTLDANLTASWHYSEGPYNSRDGLYFFDAIGDLAIALGGQPNHKYILAVEVDEYHQLDISKIAFNKVTNGTAATFQIKVNGENYGDSRYFDRPSASDLNTPFERSKTITGLTGRVNIEIDVTIQGASAIDDFTVEGSLRAYDPSAEITPDSKGIVYVDDDAGFRGDGSSWANATKELRYALAAAGSKPEIKQIWVAEGQYRPYKNESFSLVNGVQVYGGFAGDEEEFSERFYTSTLTGSGSRVLHNVNVDSTAVLDGFDIREGNAGTGNGGGIYNENASPQIRQCVIAGNTAANGGGIFNNNNSSPTLLNCIFDQNSANYGGGVYSFDSSPSVINCKFLKNTSNRDGGSIYNNGSAAPQVVNCTITGNIANEDGGGIYNRGSSSPSIRNSIIWNNSSGIVSEAGASPDISFSLLQENHDGEGNFVADPSFLNSGEQDFHLSPCSPAINKGNNQYVSEVAVDLEGLPRKHDNVVDLGAYEFQDYHVTFRTLYVNGGVSDSGDGSSWASALKTVDEALLLTSSCQGGIDSIFVAKGTYRSEFGEAISMRNGVKIYGGFAGTERFLSERDLFARHTTILRGDNNSVISNYQVDSTAVLDGFTISGGNTLYGGGMFNEESSPVISNCIFTNNRASEEGGGMSNLGSSPTIINCIFFNNEAEENAGGLYNSFSNPIIVNCTFYGNYAGDYGGGIFNYSSSPQYINCTVADNEAKQGGGVFNDEFSAAVLNNCIVYGNSNGIGNLGSLTFKYSLAEGLSNTDDGNIDGNTNPLFVNASGGDYRLQPCSPVVNRGDNAALPAGIQTDLAGNSRIYRAKADFGAYEYQGLFIKGNIDADGETVILPITAGVTSIIKDCETIAMVEPASNNGVEGNIRATVYQASDKTIRSGKAVFVARHLDLSPTMNGAARVTLLFSQEDFDHYNSDYGTANNAALPENLRIIQYHGTSISGAPESYSGAREVINRDQLDVVWDDVLDLWKVSFAITGFSGFFATGQSDEALPVKLLYFRADREENGARLRWQTTEETNSDRFEIERGTDGKTWNKIAEVAAKGESRRPENYSFLDHLADCSPSSLQYYRLKMIDSDQSYAYSKVAAVQMEALTMSVSIYPNPARREISINPKGMGARIEVEIYNMTGIRVFERGLPGTGVGKFSVESLPVGIYTVKITGNGRSLTKKLVKE
ncbi:choice-of-anchor Q domain-containing protein [Dyadobacter aurulentus]|uniref:choice-of-anchor Q domain-containing protein n=1 Tax=Dyadobacter sp. UC 10 TaxID=2605428 RepID=UPI0011F0EE32|nr:choice-of-anchor Q domain-containing protein [Dyadobacter sp. UC 10]KAA0993370.1 T9SS type A sorting domain-containing protein [Dyadobacter sp. UC 10]